MNLTKLKWLALYPLRYLFMLIGKDWRIFYSFILNRQDRKIKISDITNSKHKNNFWAIDTGIKVKKLLIRKGLKKNHDFLDYGCGYGRMAIPFIKYLNNNKYVGVDLSKVRVKLAKEYIASENCKKKYKIYLSLNKSLHSLLCNHKFDFILLYSVINHNPKEEVYKVLKELKRHLKPKGKIFFDYQEYGKDNPNNYFTTFLGFTIERSVKDFNLETHELEVILKDLDLKYSEVKEFKKFNDSIVSKFYKKMVMVEHA